MYNFLMPQKFKLIKRIVTKELCKTVVNMAAGAVITVIVSQIYYAKGGNDLKKLNKEITTVIGQKTIELGNQMDIVIRQKTQELDTSMNTVIAKKTRELADQMDTVIDQKTKKLGNKLDKITEQAEDISRSLNIAFVGFKNKGLLDATFGETGRINGLYTTLPSVQLKIDANAPQVSGQEVPPPSTK